MDWLLGGMAALALALAWPVPLLLARAHWVVRSPRAALVMWQAIALGGALSMGAALIGASLPEGMSVIELWRQLRTGSLPRAWSVGNAIAFSTAVLFACLLLANVAHAAWVTELKRRQHRARVDVLSQPLDGEKGVRLLNHPAPMAFCLPGVRNVTVLSSGLVELFSPDEFDAVLAHERAHLRGQHHLLLLAFRAWHDTLPWLPFASRAEGAVAALIELVADDSATRQVPRASLARALECVGGSWEDGLSFGQGPAYTSSASLAIRLERLRSERNRISPLARLGVGICAASLVASPLLFLAATLPG